MPKTIIPPTPGWNDGPKPTRADVPPAWDDMSATEKAMFVYRWRKEHGYAPDTGDPFADAGFEQTKYEPEEEG
jgi:hypothetical protein